MADMFQREAAHALSLSLKTILPIFLLLQTVSYSQTGTVVWRSGGSSTPKSSVWDGLSFSPSDNTVNVGKCRIFAAAEDPTDDQIIVIGVDDDEDVIGFMNNGPAWQPLPFTPLATVSESFWWGFDVAFAHLSGDAIVVWNNGNSGTRGISYRIHDGSAWSREDTLVTPLAGEPQQMRLAASPLSDEMVLVVSNSSSYDYVFVWDGSDWIDTLVLHASSGDDRTDVSVAYEQQSGRAMVVYGINDPQPKFRIWNGSSWSAESAISKPGGVGGQVRWTTLGAHSASNRIVLGVLTDANQVWLAVWNGTAWEESFLASILANGTDFPAVAVAFESESGEALAFYSEGDPVKYRTWNSTSKWSSEASGPDVGGKPNTVILDAAPASDNIMLSMQDDDHDLNCVLWNGSGWGSPTELETNTEENKNQPFVFVWNIDQAANSAPILDYIGSRSVSEGSNLNFEVTASDPDLTTTALVAQNLPTNATFIDNGNGTGSFTFNPDFTQSGTYNVRFIASDGSLADSELVAITVSNLNRAPVLATIGSRSVTEGATLSFGVSATDPDGTTPSLSAEEIPTNGAFVDNGNGTGNFSFSPSFTQAGVYNVTFIASDGTLTDVEVVQITVNAAPLSYIMVAPDSATVSADSTRTFSVTGFDAGGYETSPGTISWSLTSALGTIGAGGVFNATTVGIARVVAVSNLGPVDTSAYLRVVPGLLSVIEISPERDTISADSTRLFTASGTDVDGNAVASLGNLAWAVLNGIGSINSSGLFTAVRTGNGFVRVMSDIGPTALSDTITVTPGEISYIDVTPASTVVTEGSACQFHVYSHDFDSNLIADETSGAAWSTTDPSGAITTGGLYTAGSNPSPPSHFVKSVLGTIRDSSVVTVVSSGSISYVRVETLGGSQYNDTTLTTDDDGTEFYSRAYSSAHSLIGDISATWSLISSQPVGSIPSGPDTWSPIALTTPGTGRVVATYSGAIADTTGIITCIPGAPSDAVISPNTATIATDSSLQFACTFYDADGNATTLFTTMTWSLIGDIGTISSTGLLTPSQTGIGYVVCSGSGIADTTGAIAVVAGDLHSIEISPDSIELVVGGSQEFSAAGTDEDGNPADVGTLSWTVIGGVGLIDSDGEFTAAAPGVGKIAVASSIGGIADTNTAVVVQPSSLNLLIVFPDTASLMLTASKSFTAVGFDASFQPAYVGELTWKVLGGIGEIDSLGNFTATSKGAGRIIATSSIDSVSDTTRLIVVEVPTISEEPIGNIYTQPRDAFSPACAFRMSNAFDSPNQMEGVTARLALNGAGSSSQQLSNIDSLHLYKDANGNEELDAADTRLSSKKVYSSVVNFSFSPITVGPGSDGLFFVSLKTDLYPHDSDSVDVYLNPATDIRLVGGLPVAGPDTVNSLGYCIIDGLISDQLSLTPVGSLFTAATDQLVHVMTVDLPRNGYSPDTLTIFSVYNQGSAGPADVDSLVLMKDNGNGVWDGAASETPVGGMKFTGGLWTVSGLSQPLDNQVERFFVAARLTSMPTNGASMAFGVPVKAIEMASGNDGPIDSQIEPVDNIVILSSESLSARVIELQSDELIPGQSTGPILAFELMNTLSEDVSLSGIHVKLVASDPKGATQAELESQIESASLWLKQDGDHSVVGPSDIEVATAGISDGGATFAFDDITIGAGGAKVVLCVESMLDGSLAKNGNTIGFAIESSDDIKIVEGSDVLGDFPLSNSQQFIVNSFQSSMMVVHGIEGGALIGGQEDQPVLDVEIPGDGYDAAILQSFSMSNSSSSDITHSLSSVKLWMDNDKNGFDTGDIFLVQLAPGSGSWSNGNISTSIPMSGVRLIVTAAVGTAATRGGTLLPQIPQGGIGFASGTTGPDNHAVANPESFAILPSDQITVVSVPVESAELIPGSRQNVLLRFALYNGYREQIHSLESIRLSNFSRTVSTPSFADFEIGQLSLYYDADSNRILDGDPIIAVGYLSDGTCNLTGLGVSLEPQSITHFFVTADIPLPVIDSDVLAVGVKNGADFSFEETVNVNGDLPLLPGGVLVIDGSIAAQYEVLPTPEQNVWPGQDSVVLFSFIPTINGDQSDNLIQLTIESLGSAAGESVSDLALWVDANDDSIWQSSDSLIGYATSNEQSWSIDGLHLDMQNSSPTLFVVGKILSDAATGSTLRFAVPIDGCQFASGNDGPVDTSLESSHSITITDAGLRLTYEIANSTYSVGQQIRLDISVLNKYATDLDSVYCRVAQIDNPGLVTLADSMLGPLSIGAGDEGTFYLQYSAIASGAVSWELQAYSAKASDSSAVISTEVVLIQETPAFAIVELISSIPTSATRGQTHLFPLSLICSHSESDLNSAPLRLDSVILNIEDADGSPLAASSVFSGVVLSSGYTVLSIVEDIPDEPSVTMHFSKPLTIEPGDSRQISVRTDIDSSATSNRFAIAIESGNSIPFRDANSGAAVDIDPAIQFPLRTATCRVDDPSRFLTISSAARLSDKVNYGQQRVELLDLIFSHPGDPGSSQIQLSGIEIAISDGQGNALNASDVLEHVSLERRSLALGQASASDDSTLELSLTSPPVFSPGEVDTLSIIASLATFSSAQSLEVSITDTSCFTVRDLSSGSVISVIGDDDSILVDNLFPISSGVTQIVHASSPPEVCLDFTLDETLVAGSDSVPLLDIDVDYAVPTDHASVVLGSVRMLALDSAGRALDPYRLFDRIGYRSETGEARYQQFFELDNGFTVFDLVHSDHEIAPGEKASLELIVDINSDVPYDRFSLVIPVDGGIGLIDANDTAFSPGFRALQECEFHLPLLSDVSSIVVPAGQPRFVSVGDRVQAGYRGQQHLDVPFASLSYVSASRQGDLELMSVRFDLTRRTANGLSAAQASTVFDGVQLVAEGAVIAEASIPYGSQVIFSLTDYYRIVSGDESSLSLICRVSNDAVLGNYLFAIADSTSLELRDANLKSPAYPALNTGAYPFYSTELTISQQTLSASFSNYPNPFNPSANEETRILFVLPEAANVSIEVFSITGELVKTIAAGDARDAGQCDSDIWSGRNNHEVGVIPGTYFCKIIAKYSSGAEEIALRKIAVVR